MTPEQIEAVIETAIAHEFNDAWIYILLASCLSLLVAFLYQYFKEKGKNLATKEDIEDITDKVESVKSSHKVEFDKIQKENEVIYSEINDTKIRYNSKQFELYNQLWSSLVELKISANNLWETATFQNLKDFSIKLNDTKITVEKTSLLIEDNHYQELMNTIIQFEQYQNGKFKIVQIRSKSSSDEIGLALDSYIKGIIQNNEALKKSYEALLEKLKEQFKTTMRGESSNKASKPMA